MNDYEQRKQDRIDRYLEKAEKARAESSALSQQAHTMLSAIPPGQRVRVPSRVNGAARENRFCRGQSWGWGTACTGMYKLPAKFAAASRAI